MVHHIRQHRTGMFLIVAHLRAAVWMGKGHHVFQAASHQLLCRLFQGLGNGIDAAHCGDDPDLVAHAGFAVGTAETFKVRPLRLRHLGMGGFVCIVQQISQGGLYIVHMDPLAFLNLFFGVSDAESVFDHFAAFRDRLQRDLMALGNLLQRRHLRTADLQRFPFCDGTQRDRHIVFLIDPDDVLHGLLLLFFLFFLSEQLTGAKTRP